MNGMSTIPLPGLSGIAQNKRKAGHAKAHNPTETQTIK